MKREDFIFDHMDDEYEDYWFKVVGDTKDELTKKYMEMCMVSVTEVVYSNKEQVLGIKRLFPFNYDVIMPDDTELKDMLWKDCGINWNDFPVDCKRGSACYKTRVRETVSILNNTETVEVFRNRWVIDREPPIFSQEREYVEKWI